MQDTQKSIRFYTGNITELGPNEVFVFGANQDGFHGAGSAGYASFNVPGNRWREMNYGSRPKGWQGCWNRKGHVGPMEGTCGKSYGLVTVTRAGAKRSIPANAMIGHIQALYKHAGENPGLTFLVAQSDKMGLNGYTGREMADFFSAAATIPPNIAFQKEFALLVSAAHGTPIAEEPISRNA